MGRGRDAALPITLSILGIAALVAPWELLPAVGLALGGCFWFFDRLFVRRGLEPEDHEELSRAMQGKRVLLWINLVWMTALGLGLIYLGRASLESFEPGLVLKLLGGLVFIMIGVFSIAEGLLGVCQAGARKSGVGVGAPQGQPSGVEPD